MIVANEVICFYFRGKRIMPHKIIMVSGIEMKMILFVQNIFKTIS